ncbi:MAG: hypothetical protein SH868_16725 [Bythopirellula sp.]|nr:hypothetical protein [Bythopirellula sp.]
METVILIKVVELLGKAIGGLFSSSKPRKDDKRAAKLISEAITELLSLNPNVIAVRLKLSDASALATTPTEELLIAETMLEKVKSYSEKIGKTAAKKAASRKVAKKRTVKKKTAKKKSAKKK